MAQNTNSANATNSAHLAYFQLVGRVEEITESSYTQQSTGEVVRRFQLTLTNPVMRDRVTCEIPLDVAPSTADMDRWELDEAWVVVSADAFRALAFQRRSVRAGEKPVAAMVIFQAASVREATADERAAILDARKAQKLRIKQARAARRDNAQPAPAPEGSSTAA